jgi:uncharacterized membrane protein YfcA
VTPLELALLALAALVAGAVNALAGGGSILTFPALVAAGVPPLAANVTNSVALLPGYVGGVIGQRADLAGQRARLLRLLPLGVLGGIAGGLLILNSSERIFAALVPWLLIGGCLLLGTQDAIRARLQRRHGGALGLGWAIPPVALGAVYGGYFGAGLGVMFLAVLGLTLEDTLTRLNALKQALSLATNVAAGLVFVASPLVHWPAALVMAVGALAGGTLGGRLARVVAPRTLRAIVIAIGVSVALVFLVRG